MSVWDSWSDQVVRSTWAHRWKGFWETAFWCDTSLLSTIFRWDLDWDSVGLRLTCKFCFSSYSVLSVLTWELSPCPLGGTTGTLATAHQQTAKIDILARWCAALCSLYRPQTLSDQHFHKKCISQPSVSMLSSSQNGVWADSALTTPVTTAWREHHAWSLCYFYL